MSNVPEFTPGPPPSSSPADAVKGPAIFLLVVGGLIILGNMVGLVLNLLGVGLGAMGGQGDFQTFFSGGIGIVLNIVNMVLGAVVVLGAEDAKAAELRLCDGRCDYCDAAMLVLLPFGSAGRHLGTHRSIEAGGQGGL